MSVCDSKHFMIPNLPLVNSIEASVNLTTAKKTATAFRDIPTSPPPPPPAGIFNSTSSELVFLMHEGNRAERAILQFLAAKAVSVTGPRKCKWWS